MKSCPFCAARVGATQKYCRDCGGRLELTEPGLPPVARDAPTEIRRAVTRKVKPVEKRTTKKRAAVRRK